MRIKHILASMGLTMMCGIGALVGLTHVNEMKMANADGETWMLRIQFDAGEMDIWTDEGAVSNYRIHLWGTDWNDTYSLNLMNGGSTNKGTNVYATNITLPTTKAVTGGCFIVDQVKQANNYSNNIVNCEFTHDGTYFLGTWAYSSWTSTNFDTSFVGREETPVFHNSSTSSVKAFTANPAMNRWECLNVEIGDHFIYFSIGGNYSISVLTGTARDDFGTNGSDVSSTFWYKLNSEGVFNFYLYGESEGNGQMAVQKEGRKTTTYVYYVTGESDATVNYVYTFGGVKQFGNWPGTKVTEVSGVVDVTHDHILHFNGTMNRVYRIPVVIGCDGDSLLKINYQGDPKAESSAKEICPGYGFKWEDDDMSFDLGNAVDLLYAAETARNSVTAAGDIKAYSVCGVSVPKATELVEWYNDMSATAKGYVDNTTVLTYKIDGTDGDELVSYHAVLEELAKIAQVSLSSNRVTTRALVMNNVTIIVIIAISTVSFAALATVLVIKKRKHN